MDWFRIREKTGIVRDAASPKMNGSVYGNPIAENVLLNNNIVLVMLMNIISSTALISRAPIRCAIRNWGKIVFSLAFASTTPNTIVVLMGCFISI